MRRVRTFKADSGKVIIKMTVEISTSPGTAWNRKSFLQTVNYYFGQATVGLINLGFPVPKVVRK